MLARRHLGLGRIFLLDVFNVTILGLPRNFLVNPREKFFSGFSERTIPIRPQSENGLSQVAIFQYPSGAKRLTHQITKTRLWTGSGPLKRLGTPPTRRPLAWSLAITAVLGWAIELVNVLHPLFVRGSQINDQRLIDLPQRKQRFSVPILNILLCSINNTPCNGFRSLVLSP